MIYLFVFLVNRNLSKSMTQELKPALLAFFDPTTEADMERDGEIYVRFNIIPSNGIQQIISG